MFKGHIARGVVLGGGAAVNVECGFEPDFVMLSNSRGSAETLVFYMGNPVLKFDSGSYEIVAGDKLKDATAGGTFTVVSVALTSGSWDGGDAAGWMEIKYVSGTVTNNNNLDLVERETRGGALNVATIDGSITYSDTDTDTEVGTPAAVFVSEYAGASAANAKGFTLAAGALPSGEFVWWMAVKADSML